MHWSATTIVFGPDVLSSANFEEPTGHIEMAFEASHRHLSEATFVQLGPNVLSSANFIESPGHIEVAFYASH